MPETFASVGPGWRTGAIVLAAGGSTRMGAPKQLLGLAGKSLVERSVEAALGSGAHTVVVVVGAYADRVQEHLAGLPARVVLNPDWASGMASSLRVGLSAVLGAEPALDALAVVLCDQPALSSAMVRCLFEAQRNTGRIAAARYGGRHGVPAVFGRIHFPALGQLTGDQGAREILNSPSIPVTPLDLPALGVDLDTPADFKLWAASQGPAIVVSVHVPKTAGTSFRRVLEQVCGARTWYNYGAIFSRAQAKAELVPPGTRFIHGHFLADAFDDLFPDRRLVTWVRHPVERLLSNYYHFLRSPDMRDDCCRELHERKLSLRQFADLEWMRNYTAHYLADKPVADFEFIGIAERFDESIRRFCEVFGFRDASRIPHENTNPERTGESYGLSPEDRAYILERNAADLAWYLQAAERLGPAPA